MMSKRVSFLAFFLCFGLLIGNFGVLFCEEGESSEILVPEVELDTSLSYTSAQMVGSPLVVKTKKVKKSRARSSKSKKRSSAGRSKTTGSKSKVKKGGDPEKDLYQWFQTYAEIVSLVQRKGFRTVDFAKFIQNSLKAAVANVDAHSSFFDQDSYKAAIESTSGEFSGIGVSIISKTPEDDALVIVDVLQGSPAEKAGLKNGDKIIEVNKEKLRGLSTDEALMKLKGKVGTEVVIKLIRGRRPMEFKVARDIIKDQTSICYYFANQNVYYLSLTLFTEKAADQIAALLKKAREGKSKGIILDLRRNPGGTLDSAIDMAGLFLPKESLVVVTKDKNRNVVSRYFTKSEPLLQDDIPIFILINNLTASAAEILAGCLAYHSKQGGEDVPSKHLSKKENTRKSKHAYKRKLMVFLVGTSTFGKGSVQELIPIKNGCALKLTTMLYFLPGDLSLQATGIQPDFLIRPKLVPVDELKWIADLYGKETALKSHITVKEVEETYGIKPVQRIDEEQKDAKELSSGLENIVEFDEDAPGKSQDVLDKNKKDPVKNWEADRQKALALDVQVQACVNMINLLDFAKQNDDSLVATRQKALDFLKVHYLTDEPAQLTKVM